MAILIVLFCHLNFHLNHIYGLDSRILASGWNGVYLFFVLSGYLITRSLGQFSLKTNLFRYYAKRIIRTWFLYYFVIVLYLLSGHNFESLLYYLTFSHNFLEYMDPFHLWSIAVEEQIYLVYPLILFALVKKRFFGLALIAIIVLRLFLDDNRLLFVALDSFLLGCFVYKLETDGRLSPLKNLLVKYKLVVLNISFVIIYAPILLNLYNSSFRTIVYFSQGLGFSLILAIIVLTDYKESRLLNLSSLQYLGRSSYSTYLIHPLVITMLLGYPSMPSYVFVLSFIFIQLAVTYTMYQFLEKPIINFGKKVSYQ